MLRIALIFGAISGSIIIAIMIAGYAWSDGEGFGASQALGYTVMIIALSMIFIGVKRYRDRDLGGVIKFAPAFAMGVAIAAVAGVFYVAGWETYLALSDNAFIDNYTAGIIEAKRDAGLSGAALEAIIANMEALKQQYANPLYRLPMTFIEVFPVGLVVALITAAILRNPKRFPARG